jgi:hypothetical protein
MIYDDGGEKVLSGGRTCPCGGQISKGVLKGGRERWRCTACGRYEVMYGLPSESEPEGNGGAHLVE